MVKKAFHTCGLMKCEKKNKSCVKFIIKFMFMKSAIISCLALSKICQRHKCKCGNVVLKVKSKCKMLGSSFYMRQKLKISTIFLYTSILECT